MRAFPRVLHRASLFLCVLCAACVGDPEDEGPGGAGGEGGASGLVGRRLPSFVDGGGEGGEGGAGGDGGGFSGAVLPGACPLGMALIGSICMDRFEAPNVPGALPLVMESAVTATAWCAERGKRLCTEDEWDTACAGPEGFVYPYGDVYEAGRCNDGKTWIAPNEATLATWPSAEAQAEVDSLYQGEPSGSLEGCVSGYGVFDLTGNVEEWVVRTKPHANSYPHVLKGCYWSGCYGGSKPTCASTNPAHADGFLFYETSFRCCRDAG